MALHTQTVSKPTGIYNNELEKVTRVWDKTLPV